MQSSGVHLGAFHTRTHTNSFGLPMHVLAKGSISEVREFSQNSHSNSQSPNIRPMRILILFAEFEFKARSWIRIRRIRTRIEFFSGTNFRNIRDNLYSQSDYQLGLPRLLLKVWDSSRHGRRDRITVTWMLTLGFDVLETWSHTGHTGCRVMLNRVKILTV
jgi:hypothetical protein